LDEITRGIRHAIATLTVPIWVSFGMQTLLDIQDMFTTSIEKPFHELQAHLQYASKTLAKDLDFCWPFEATGYEYARTERAYTILQDIYDWTRNDNFASMLRQEPSVVSHPVLGSVSNQHNFMMKNHPLRCGMLNYDCVSAASHHWYWSRKSNLEDDNASPSVCCW
jgi:hypothetical protein